MVSSHFSRILKNKISICFFLIILFIPMVEIVLILRQQLNSTEVYHPAFSFFLSGSSIGHAPQIILLWFLPLYLLLLGADDSIQDSTTGYRNILMSKIGKGNYVKEKLMTSFSISFLTLFISLGLNLIMVSLIFHNGTYSRGLRDITLPNNILFNFSMEHPYITVLLFIIIASFLAGLCGLLGSSLSLLFKNKKYTYATTFFVWFALVLSKYSVMHVFQPFTETSLTSISISLIITTFLLIVIPIIIYVYEVKYVEI